MAVALGLSLFNGVVIGIIGPPPLIMTFATSTIWFGLALVLMPTPGGHIPEAFYGLYGKTLGRLIPVPVLVLLVALAFCILLGRLRAFRHLYAVGGSERAARASGINVTQGQDLRLPGERGLHRPGGAVRRRHRRPREMPAAARDSR